MTIAGSGGIGKTTVALGIAHRFEATTSARAFFRRLCASDQSASAASTIALAMGAPVSTRLTPIPHLIAGNRQ